MTVFVDAQNQFGTSVSFNMKVSISVEPSRKIELNFFDQIQQYENDFSSLPFSTTRFLLLKRANDTLQVYQSRDTKLLSDVQSGHSKLRKD